ncbi:hypothetical protein ACF06T_24355 [Streptomyces albidoflavus]
MANRMDVLLAALDRQGFKSWQGLEGSWFFSRDGNVTTIDHEPGSAGEWLDLVSTLRDMGLVLPYED